MTPGGRVLVVCTGNVCRSPFVERVLAHRMGEGGLPAERRVQVSSAGTAALVGEPMDPRCAAQVSAAGGVADGFAARQLTAAMVAGADLVLTATRAHRAVVVQLHPRALAYTFAVRDFAMLVAELPAAVDRPGAPANRAAGLAARAAARRGLSPPLAAADADVVDPFARPDPVVLRMVRQLDDALPPIVRAFAGTRGAGTPSPPG